MQKNKIKYFYVYYSYEPWGRGYIGKRECWCLPEEDIKYFGSFYDKTFKPTEKIILETFDTLEDALSSEILLHNFYEVDKNLHFANKSKQTTKGFYFCASGKDHPRFGKKTPIEVRKKQSKSALGEKNPMYGRTRVHSEETKEKLRKKANEHILRKKLQLLEEN
jgi:hypothetical protein